MQPIYYALFVTLALSGCASYSWTKPGFSNQQFAADKLECKAMSRRLAQYPDSILIGTDHDQNMVTCIESKGYTRISR